MKMVSFVEYKCSFIIFETLSCNKVYKLLPVIICCLASNNFLSYRLLVGRVIMTRSYSKLGNRLLLEVTYIPCCTTGFRKRSEERRVGKEMSTERVRK